MKLSLSYQRFVLIRTAYSPAVVNGILLGSRCLRCTAWKPCGRPFCESCFQALPNFLRKPLFKVYSLDLIEAIHHAVCWHLARDEMNEADRSPTSDPDYHPGTVAEYLFPDIARPSQAHRH